MHVKRLSEMLREYGKRIIMEADFFSSHADRDALGADFSGNHQGAVGLPGDIICMDWTSTPDLRGSILSQLKNTGHEILVHSFTCCMERVFPAYRERIANIEGYIREAIKHKVLGEVNAGYEPFCHFFEDFWYGTIYSGELAWSGNIKTNMDEFDKNFSCQFFGLDTGELTDAIHLLADCNVFENGGGSQDPFPTWDVFKDIASHPYGYMERQEILGRIKVIPDRAEKALKLIRKGGKKVKRNKITVDFLELAAKRWFHETRKVLLVEEASKYYRKGWLAQWAMWFPEKFMEENPKEVVHSMEKVIELLKEIREEIPPLKKEVRRLWLWHRKPYRLKNWFLDFYDAQDKDLTEVIDAMEGFLEEFKKKNSPWAFPRPIHVGIFQGSNKPVRRRKRFVPWGF